MRTLLRLLTQRLRSLLARLPLRALHRPRPLPTPSATPARPHEPDSLGPPGTSASPRTPHSLNEPRPRTAPDPLTPGSPGRISRLTSLGALTRAIPDPSGGQVGRSGGQVGRSGGQVGRSGGQVGRSGGLSRLDNADEHPGGTANSPSPAVSSLPDYLCPSHGSQVGLPSSRSKYSANTFSDPNSAIADPLGRLCAPNDSDEADRSGDLDASGGSGTTCLFKASGLPGLPDRPADHRTPALLDALRAPALSGEPDPPAVATAVGRGSPAARSPPLDIPG